MSRTSILGSVGGSFLVLTMAGFFWGVGPRTTCAAPKAERNNAAQQLVREALHREIYGRSGDRGELLGKALEQVPDYSPAMWHRGFVRYQNKWVQAEDLPQLLSREQRMESYEKVRDKYENTVAGQFALAQWCGKHGLADQMRAHLTAVLTIDADHAEARALLGFRRVDDEWLTAAEIEKSAAQAAAESATIAAWRPKLDKLLHGLHRDGQIHRDTAAARLREIRDVSAIPALEALVARDSESAARVVVDVLSAMPESAASLALARQAVASPWKSVRAAAATALVGRPEDGYVPALLSSLTGPVVSTTALFSTPTGGLLYRHTFTREQQDKRDVLALDTAYNRVARLGGSGNESAARAVNGAFNDAQARELSVAERNRLASEANGPIFAALKTATRQALPDQADAWWNWWNERNEVFVEGGKQERTAQLTQQVAIVDRTDGLRVLNGVPSDADSQLSISPPRRKYDCLAAGTLVWTASGTRAIETIRVGDLVLSQDPESGELAYKPVLRTTVRPRSQLIKIVAGSEIFQTSGGHLFWVSGEGWVKSRDLQSGQELHTVRGSLCVSTVETGREAETYNLIVGDFNSYFVGQSQVLSHDNTVRQVTGAVVPGLIER